MKKPQRTRIRSKLYARGFRKRDVKPLCGDNLKRLRFWLAGPSSFAMIAGGAYGLILGFPIGRRVGELALADLGSRGMYYILWVLVTLAASSLLMLAAIAVNEWWRGLFDRFYPYALCCRTLIYFKASSRRSLAMKERLAEATGRWQAAASKMHVEVAAYGTELEAIIDQRSVTKSDVRKVNEIGRQALLAPLVGRIDMRGLTTRLAAPRFAGGLGLVAKPIVEVVVAVVAAVLAAVIQGYIS